MRRFAVLAGTALAVLAAACGSPRAHPPVPTPPRVVSGPPRMPRPGHVMVVVFENKGYGSVIGSGAAPYINGLAAHGAELTHFYAIRHPSQPNYLALFSGSTRGVTGDGCPRDFPAAPNLGRQLLDAGHTFAIYSESMPADGYKGCAAGRYARKHNPVADFGDVPASSNLTYSRLPADYAALPTVSFVIPNLCDDMHDCPVATGDAWLRAHLDGYARWAQAHNSLLVVTFDEDDSSGDNRIPTIIIGGPVKPGAYPELADHYSMLRTIEALYGLPGIGEAAHRYPLTGIWF